MSLVHNEEFTSLSIISSLYFSRTFVYRYTTTSLLILVQKFESNLLFYCFDWFMSLVLIFLLLNINKYLDEVKVNTASHSLACR